MLDVVVQPQRRNRILRLRPLERVSVSADNFVLSGDTWQIRAGDRILSVSQSVEIHMTGPDLWLSGSDSLTALLDGSHDLTAWVDTTGKTLAQVRILQATPR